MKLSTSLVTLATLAVGSAVVVAQTPSAATASMAPGMPDMSAIPPCFLSCSAEAATKVNCTGPTDLPCVCTKQSFVNENGKCSFMKCPELAANATVSQGSFQVLEMSCKAAIGDKFNLTMPTAAEIGMGKGMGGNHTNATTSTMASGTAAGGSTTPAPAAGTSAKDAAAVLCPPLAHVVSATVVLSVLLGGTSLLF